MRQYKLIQADSLKFLANLPDGSLPVVVTGLPDMEELNMSEVDEYLDWFNKTSDLLFQKIHPDGYLILVQTDRKKNGSWIDKSFYLTQAANFNNFNLMWHKICINRSVDSISLHRPSYSHLLAYSMNGKPGIAFPDLISAGKRIYPNATPLNVLTHIMEFLQNAKLPNSKFPQIIDPFVGQGSVIYMARKFGFTSLGIDIDPKQLEIAEQFLENS